MSEFDDYTFAMGNNALDRKTLQAGDWALIGSVFFLLLSTGAVVLNGLLSLGI